MKFSYFDDKYVVRAEVVAENKGRIKLMEHMYSLRVFTAVGQQLALISGAAPVPGFVEDLLQSLNSEQGKTRLYFDKVIDERP